MSELKSCPCCSADPPEEWSGGRQILCERCGLGTSVEDTPEKALAVWNTRVPDATLSAEVERLKEENLRLRQLDREAATHVESVICMRTHFTGEPPYVGWKGLGLALNEALDQKDTAEAEVERLRGERNAAIMEVSRQSAARGRAEGALATSETAGVVEGWRARAEAAEAEVERLRNEADSEFVAAAVRVMRASPGFDLRDYQDGITADDFEMFFTEDMNEAWRRHEKERARAEAAEARVAVLEEALHRISNQAQNHDERGITYSVGYAFSRVQGIARSALSHTKEEVND